MHGALDVVEDDADDADDDDDEATSYDDAHEKWWSYQLWKIVS